MLMASGTKLRKDCCWIWYSEVLRTLMAVLMEPQGWFTHLEEAKRERVVTESIVLFSRRFTDRKNVGGSFYSWKKPGMTDLFKNHECLVKYLPKQWAGVCDGGSSVNGMGYFRRNEMSEFQQLKGVTLESGGRGRRLKYLFIEVLLTQCKITSAYCVGYWGGTRQSLHLTFIGHWRHAVYVGSL